jgi:4-hydroxybenzoate polyprenyltransferase
MLKEWSKIFRSQTAPATTILIMIGFILGGGVLISPIGGFLFIYSILLHFFIFGNNSLMDACIVPRIGESPYDVNDPNKKHHPLIEKKIELRTAHKIIYTGLIILAIVGILLSFITPGHTSLSLASFIIFIVGGFAYNCGLSKSTIFKFIPISLSFSALCSYTFFFNSTMISEILPLVLFYIFLTITFQTAIEGDLKEIMSKETNLMRYLGSKIKQNHLIITLPCKAIGWSIKVITVLITTLIILKLENIYVKYVIALILTIIVLYFTYKILHSKEWNRQQNIKYFSLEEIFTIYLLLLILYPIISIFEILLLLIYGIIHFMIFNYINWGTFLSPKV